MKRFIYTIGMILIIFILIKCEKESDNDSSEQEITYVKTKSGGCNGQKFDDIRSVIDEQEDTVVFSIKNDTLDIYIGINYICCAPFISEANISNDSILINLTDTCPFPYQSCYCRCMCYYIWDFLFVDFEEKKYYFKIILNDPREENPIVFQEGSVEISISRY